MGTSLVPKMADKMDAKQCFDPKGLKQNVNSFLSGADVNGKPLSFVEKTECAIVLLQSLPCARSAVLEQLCGVFREAVQKYTVQLERQALEGSLGELEIDDPHLNSALCRVSEVVRGFVDNNPSSWAPVICQWSLTLLGQVITENVGRRGVSLNLSFSEGLHRWMAFPAIQLLIDIASHCCAELVICSPEVCMGCLLQTAVKYSPHLDWIVAHIGSHFHQIIIGKLLSTALKEYASCAKAEHSEKSVLISTVVRVLTFLSLQHSHEINTCLLDLFHASVSSCSTDEKDIQLATVPFLLHIASISPDLLKGTLSEFVETLTPAVLVQLYNQSIERENLENKQESLVSSLVDIIVNTGEGANEIFKFLLENCESSEEKGAMEFDSSQAQVQKTFIFVMELLLLKLDRIMLQRRKLYKECSLNNLGQGFRAESPFLLEMANHTSGLCSSLLSSSGNRLMWLRRLLVLVALHKGQPVAVQILAHVIMNSRSDDSLRLFTKLQCELELFYPHVLRDTVNKCVISLKNLPSASRSPKALLLLDNFYQLILTEKGHQLPPRLKLGQLLEEHYEVLSRLVSHVDRETSVRALELFLELENLVPDTVTAKRSVCLNAVAFFFNSLRELHKEEKRVLVVIESMKLCQTLFLHLTKDTTCTLHILRLLVEGTLQKENVILFGGKAPSPPDSDAGLSSESKVSLLEYNRKPQISSRLSLNPSSVFFTGVVGKSSSVKPAEENTPSQYWSNARQVFLDMFYTICTNRQEGTQTDTTSETLNVSSHCLELIASLLMELVCPDVVPSPSDWNDEEGVKSMIERNLKICRKLDENPILWTFLLSVPKNEKALLKCVPIVSSILATLVSHWELCRDAAVQRSSAQFLATCHVTQLLTEADWLPPPLCRVGAILHLLSPRELFTLMNTMWKVLKENPPSLTSQSAQPKWQQGTAVSQREVVKSVFVKNIGKLGQHYARVFSASS